MERKTAMQAAGVFVVTLVAGLPFALQAGQWLAGEPEPARSPAPAPVATGAGTDAGQPQAERPEGGPAPGYGPQGRPMLAGTGEPAASPVTAASTPVRPRPTAGPTTAPIGVPTIPPTSLPTPPASDPTEPPEDGLEDTTAPQRPVASAPDQTTPVSAAQSSSPPAT